MPYLPRIIDAQLQTLLNSVPVVTIEGARAAGKTTTAARFAASELRLPTDLDLLRSDPHGVMARLEPPVLIDEWQLAGTDVLWAIKELVDAAPRPGSFVLTSSVQPESYGATYPLTGRGSRLMMYPMNQGELGGAGGTSMWLPRVLGGELLMPSPESHPRFETPMLMESGFPSTRVVESSGWLRAYAASVAERSVDERRDPVRVKRLLGVLAELEGATVPDETIIRSADINRASFVAYDDMLQRAHVATPVAAWRTNRLKRLTAFPKRFLVDTALAVAIAGITADELTANPTLAGPFFESFVAAQIRPELGASGASLHHLRSKGGEHEIDLVVEVGGRLVPIEVKYVVRPRVDDTKHLRWFVDAMGDRVATAVLLHRGTATYEIVPGVWAMPVSSLWS